MPIVINDAKQGTPEWFALRVGIPTASRFGEIVDKDGNPSKSREKYLQELANERVTGFRKRNWSSPDMDRGTAMEAVSRANWEETFFSEITEVAFVFKDEKKRFGCSPDGLVNYDGTTIKEGWETKDAAPHIQYDRLKKGVLPSEHHRQIQGSLYVCEAELWHFRSYCQGMRSLDIAVERDEPFLRKLGIQLDIFCDDLDALVEKYRSC